MLSCCGERVLVPEDWMNADVMHSDSFNYRIFDKAQLYKIFNGVLNVYVANILDLLCMKAAAFREKDMEDIKYIVYTLSKSGVTYNILEEFNYIYSSLYILKKLADRHIKRLFNTLY